MHTLYEKATTGALHREKFSVNVFKFIFFIYGQWLIFFSKQEDFVLWLEELDILQKDFPVQFALNFLFLM